MAADDQTTLAGLSDAEVADRVAKGQTNDAPDPRSRSLSSIIRENTVTSFNIVIFSLFILMVIARASYQDMLFVIIIFVNSGIGIFQEWRAKRTLERLSLIGEAKPVVRRNGARVEVSPHALVLDDIIELSTGDQIVVDGELLTSAGLEADESLLTGEADPVEKEPGDGLMSGSFVVAGGGVMKATKVGLDSYATKLASEARQFKKAESELMGSIMRFVRTITWVLFPLGLLLFWSQLQSSPNWSQALTGAVAGIVTMVPEGLVLLTSIAMAVAVVRLGQKRALVQEMPAVEVLARVDVVCVDKTGTLTEPGMAVKDMQIVSPEFHDKVVKSILGGLGSSEANPNPTLGAVAKEFGSSDLTMIDSVPFSSTRKWSAAEFGDQGWWLLGAPEVLLASASDQDAGTATQACADQLASTGARVLLLAKSDPGQQPSAEGGSGLLTPIAVVSIDQRLRSDAAETVAYFLDQGVEIKVISGDNPVTVGAIAAQAGIPRSDDPVDAREMPESTEEIAELLETHAVFGRVTPAQKRAMVSALQSKGHTVAMTGDGVNDVLALKDADLGIAMGSGAGATRAVAQLVLLDSQFSVLPNVVAEGRRVLGNIERVSDLFLTKSFYAMALSFITVILTLTNIYKVEFIFLPRHLTVITALSIGIPAFLLALMPNKQRFKPGFFKRVLRFSVPAGIICAVSAFGCYLVMLVEGHQLDEARTGAAITLFIVAWFVLLLIARPLNPLRLGIVIVMGLGFIAVLYIPWLSQFFALSLGIDGGGGTSVAFGIAGAIVLVLVRRFIEVRVTGETEPAH